MRKTKHEPSDSNTELIEHSQEDWFLLDWYIGDGI